MANPFELGIGDIVMSVLEENEFRQVHGDLGAKSPQTSIWLRCDGQSCAGSLYAEQFTKTNVPDFKGRYPRGYNPETPMHKAGVTQEDSLKKHSHQLENWSIMRDAKGEQGETNHVLRTGYGGNVPTSGVIDASTDDETRPKTLIVNFYIRIN